MQYRKALWIAIAVALSGVGSGSAVAQTQWQKDHPRRVEVNKRLANQNRRVNREVKEGEMGKAQAAKVKRQDRRIRGEERAMAKQNGSHITKQEQRRLNRQENRVSREIGK